jgi:autotransporter translocation and assembly factor TamB
MKWKILAALVLIVAAGLTLFLAFPRVAGILMSYKKQCKVVRVEVYVRGAIVTNASQANKISVLCDDGTICRAEDTGFSAVKAGDDILFRGYPEYSTFEEFGKCDHAQLIQIVPGK